MVPVACCLLEWKMCIPPMHFLWPVISAKFFWIQVFHRTLKENIHFKFKQELQWRGCTYHCYAFRVVNPMLSEVYYSRLYEEEIMLISNVTCPFVMLGPYISYIDVFLYATDILFLPSSPRGPSHWTLLTVWFTYDVTLPLVSSRTSHSKDDTLMECTRKDDTTQCEEGMLCVSLSCKHTATCVTCATELGIITGFAVLC
jgi:hypothetical protein